MSRLNLVSVGATAIALATAWLAVGVAPVRAGVIELDVSAKMSPGGSAACAAAGCTLGGDIVIDNTNNRVNSADVTAAGFGAGPFTKVTEAAAAAPLYVVTINDPIGDLLILTFATPSGSLIGYTGGPLSPDTVIAISQSICDHCGAWTLISGSLTEAAAVSQSVPEPSVLLLLLPALAGALASAACRGEPPARFAFRAGCGRCELSLRPAQPAWRNPASFADIHCQL